MQDTRNNISDELCSFLMPLDFFYSKKKFKLPKIALVPGSDLPETKRKLLAHKTDMTSTLTNHHGSDLSFVYYPNIEPKQGNLHFKVFANTDTYEKQIVPTTGMLLIFKSSIPHYTGKNVSGKNRYCISGNFKRKESV